MTANATASFRGTELPSLRRAGSERQRLCECAALRFYANRAAFDHHVRTRHFQEFDQAIRLMMSRKAVVEYRLVAVRQPVDQMVETTQQPKAKTAAHSPMTRPMCAPPSASTTMPTSATTPTAFASRATCPDALSRRFLAGNRVEVSTSGQSTALAVSCSVRASRASRAEFGRC